MPRIELNLAFDRKREEFLVDSICRDIDKNHSKWKIAFQGTTFIEATCITQERTIKLVRSVAVTFYKIELKEPMHTQFRFFNRKRLIETLFGVFQREIIEQKFNWSREQKQEDIESFVGIETQEAMETYTLGGWKE